MNTPLTSTTSPPVAPLALRIGVVGHRPERLQQANLPQLIRTIREILASVKEEVKLFQIENSGLYSEDDPILRAVTPLAEGSDRIFAEQALDEGYNLCCIMPFHRSVFEKDFLAANSQKKNSLEHFNSILYRAEKDNRLTCFELDGNHKKRAQAYSLCGQTVLNQSDLLIVIWDGESHGKVGGTEETFKNALRMGIPLIWINARADHKWQIIEDSEGFCFPSINSKVELTYTSSLPEIRVVVNKILQFTQQNTKREAGEKARDKTKEQSILKEFYNQHKPRFTTAVFWKCFIDLFGDNRLTAPVFKIPDFEKAVIHQWPEDNSKGVSDVVKRIRPYYAWPDKMAVLYSDRYRSAFLITFIFAALAVGVALLPIAGDWELHSTGELICVWAEIVLMVSIIVVVLIGKRKKWHERWIDYRIIAESLRHLRLVSPLGGERPFLQSQAFHKTYGQPESGWMAWYVKAVERFMGLPTVVVDKAHLLTCLNHLSEVIDDQTGYHLLNAKRCEKIERRLHIFGMAMLVLTILACLLHLMIGMANYITPSWLPPGLLTFFCGFFPALGAASAGINYQGEFRRISKRSEAMYDQLNVIKCQVEKITADISNSPDLSGDQFSVRASEIAGKTAGLLTNEVLDWRVVFLDRPLNASA